MLKLNLHAKIGIGLAKQLAKHISKEDFMQQLEQVWAMQLGNTSGAIDLEKETRELKKRLKMSGYAEIFKSVGITEDELADQLRRITQEMGKSIKNE